MNASKPATLAGTLATYRSRALLFRDLATLRTDVPVFDDVDELRWKGPTRRFAKVAELLDWSVSVPEPS